MDNLLITTLLVKNWSFSAGFFVLFLRRALVTFSKDFSGEYLGFFASFLSRWLFRDAALGGVIRLA